MARQGIQDNVATTRAVKRSGAVTAGLLLLFLAWFGWDSWQEGRRSQVRDMRTVLEITATAIDRYLREVEASLGALAFELEQEGAMDDMARVQVQLRRFHDAHPDAASITLSRRSDGLILASSTTARLHDLPANRGVGGPIFPASQDDSKLARRLVLGRPLLGALTQKWVFPLAYMVYDRDKRIKAVLTIAMPVDFVQAFWNAAPLSQSVAIGLVRDDGLLVSRWKLPEGVPLSQIYGVRRTGTLEKHLIDASFPASGIVEGFNEFMNETASFVYRRLPRFNVTAYVAAPSSLLTRNWVQRVAAPYCLAVLMASMLFLAYRDILRRRAAAEAESRAAAVATEASAAKSQFIARMSHELRTPLNAVLGLSELMALDKRSALSQAQRERLALMQASSRHLLTLINDLLDLSQIEAGAVKVHSTLFRPVELIQEVIEEMSPLAAKLGVETSSHATCTGTDFAYSDRTRLKQVLLNLISNAIKYNESGGRVDLDARCHPDRLELTVTDTGPGMTRQQLDSLFQPFNRLGRDGSTVGAGIGLTITRSLVELLRGELRVESEVGRGSTFSVVFPLEPPPDDAKAELSRRLVGGVTSGTAALIRLAETRPLSVLYVDDDEVNRLVVDGYLSLVPNLRCATVSEGWSFLEHARRSPPDVALVDIMMPGMDGIAVLRAVRADEQLRHIACIAVSANALTEEVRSALAAGFDGYVTKPITADSLYDEIVVVWSRLHP